MPDSTRRLLLRLGVKSLLLVTALAVLGVMLASVRGTQRETPALPLLAHPITAPLERISWSAGNVLVVYRDEQVLDGLRARHDDHLRAQRPAWVVLYDRGGELGCPLEWIPAGHRQAPVQPWHGGFRELCQHHWFDASGRSLDDNPARDIAIPPHHWQGENLLILGESGDNPAP